MERLISELLEIHSELQGAMALPEVASARKILFQAEERAYDLEKSHSGSWLAGQENLYFGNFEQPPAQRRYSPIAEGLVLREIGWMPRPYDAVVRYALQDLSDKELSAAINVAADCKSTFQRNLERTKSILHVLNAEADEYVLGLRAELYELRIPTEQLFINKMAPANAVADIWTITKGPQTPPHLKLFAHYAVIRHGIDLANVLADKIEYLMAHLNRVHDRMDTSVPNGQRIFIGHGRSLLWRELKDYLEDDLGLECDEFNRVATEGITIMDRLSQMLDDAAFAFLIMTAEDEQADGKMQARMNVIHEAGLFQGRLGFDRAIILLEEGCEEFSNIHGLVHRSFPPKNLQAAFHGIRKLLEERGILNT